MTNVARNSEEAYAAEREMEEAAELRSLARANEEAGRADLDLMERVIARVRFPIDKHQAYELTEDQIVDKTEAEIASWSNMELLRAISLELEDMLSGQ